MAFMGWIPLGWALAVCALGGRAAFALLRSERRKALAHLRIAFPEKDEAWRVEVGRRSFMNLARMGAELLHLAEILEGLGGTGRLAGYVTIEGEEHLAAEHARGRGGLFISGHCGAWELLAAYIVHLGYTVNVIVRGLFDPGFDRLLNENRERFGVRPIAREGGSAAMEVLRALRRNEFVAILMDQDTKVRGVFVPFFGRLAHTPSGAAHFACRAGVDVLPGFVHRRPEGGHAIVIHPPAPRPRSGDREADVLEYTAALTRYIEEQIRRYPDEWVWMHRRWKKQPDGSRE